MKVFISWSGERSKQVAELFKIWLKCVIQASDPWVSTQDIESGSLWFTEIGNQLSETTTGIICLTRENKDKPWILFEAGALTKGLSTSRIVPFLVDLAPQELQPPLSQLNATEADRHGVYSLARTVNLQLKEGGLTSDVFNAVFETYWPQFESQFAKIIEATPEHEKTENRKDKDILSEILLTVRGFDKRIRQLEPSAYLKNGSVISSSQSFNEKMNMSYFIKDNIEKFYSVNKALPSVKYLTEFVRNNSISNFLEVELEKLVAKEINDFGSQKRMNYNPE